MDKFNKQTCLNVKHYCFTFQPIVQIHLNAHLLTRFWMPDAKNEAGCCRSFLLSNNCSTMYTFLTPNIYLRSRKTLVTWTLTHHRVTDSEWMAIAQSHCANRKWITERCSLVLTWCFYLSNVAILNSLQNVHRILLLKLHQRRIFMSKSASQNG